MSKTTTKRIRPVVKFPDDGLTKGSFKEECDPTVIVNLFTQTGMMPHAERRQPQYADAPEGDMFTHACVSAEIRSKIEEGFEPSEAPEEPEEAPTPPKDDSQQKLEESPEPLATETTKGDA